MVGISGAPWAEARAEGPGFQLEIFEPLPEPGLNILNISTSRMLEGWRASAGMTVHFARDALSAARTSDRGDDTLRLSDHRLTGEVSVALGLFGYVSIGAVLPVILDQRGDDLELLGRPGEHLGGAALSDLRLVTKIRFWRPESMSGFGLHLLLPLTIPTGREAQLASDGGVRVQPTLGLDYRNPEGFNVSLNVGYLVRPGGAVISSGDELRWGIGVEVPTSLPPLSVIGVLHGAYGLGDTRGPDGATLNGVRRGHPIELLGGLRARIGQSFAVGLGAGAGLAGEVGAPRYRVYLNLGYTPTVSFADSDGDGIPDIYDLCPYEPEDFDGFQDEDGCPDPDNDGDGIPDYRDQCPNEPEDFDGFQDEDGCPEHDNDGDGIPDLLDMCPNEPEDFDGFRDEDGCPDPDNDGDGIPDYRDQCPNEPEDFDGFEDEDGCPDPDNDGDGILDINDLCPNFPENFNGFEDSDGCPDTRSPLIRIHTDQIQLLRPIFFVRNGAAVRPASFPVLDAIAEVLLSNAAITLVQIEGHTDDLGAEDRNMRMSVARARAVRTYLISRGVDERVLAVKGFGATRPMAPNTTEVDRAENRRVEFRIVEVSGRPVSLEQEADP